MSYNQIGEFAQPNSLIFDECPAFIIFAANGNGNLMWPSRGALTMQVITSLCEIGSGHKRLGQFFMTSLSTVVFLPI